MAGRRRPPAPGPAARCRARRHGRVAPPRRGGAGRAPPGAIRRGPGGRTVAMGLLPRVGGRRHGATGAGEGSRLVQPAPPGGGTSALGAVGGRPARQRRVRGRRIGGRPPRLRAGRGGPCRARPGMVHGAARDDRGALWHRPARLPRPSGDDRRLRGTPRPGGGRPALVRGLRRPAQLGRGPAGRPPPRAPGPRSGVGGGSGHQPGARPARPAHELRCLTYTESSSSPGAWLITWALLVIWGGAHRHGGRHVRARRPARRRGRPGAGRSAPPRQPVAAAGHRGRARAARTDRRPGPRAAGGWRVRPAAVHDGDRSRPRHGAAFGHHHGRRPRSRRARAPPGGRHRPPVGPRHRHRPGRRAARPARSRPADHRRAILRQAPAQRARHPPAPARQGVRPQRLHLPHRKHHRHGRAADGAPALGAPAGSLTSADAATRRREVGMNPMGMGPGGGMGAGWGLMRSFRRDDSVTRVRLAPGTKRRIVQFAAPYRKLLSVFLVLIVLDAAIGAANPLIYRAIIDDGILRHRQSVAVALALVVAGLAVADAGLSLWQRWVSARVGEGLIFDMRSKVFAHIQRMPIAFFTRTQTGALVTRLNNDVLGAQQAFTDTLSSVVSNLIGVAMVLVAMFLLSWQITLVALVLLPVFVVPARWVGRRLQTITREGYALNALMNATMTERFNVAGALLVKLFGHPDRERRVRDIGVQQAMYSRVFMASLMLVASLATALVYGWGGVLAARGTLMVGTVVALTAYLNRLYGPLTALSNVQVDVMTALVSFERVFEVLDLAPMIDERPDAVALPRGPATIEFEHVDFSYPTAEEVSLASLEAVAVLERTPSRQVLHDVTFTARPGQLVALVGPSGAGKTTISHLVPRLYDVRSGAVRINGIDVRDATLSSIRDVVGVVTQDAHLFHDTIRANLRFAKPDASEQEMLDALAAAHILPMVAALPDGLDTVVGDRGYRLSGGEKQRIAIARLLLKAPDVVVLDEATAHLDSES